MIRFGTPRFLRKIWVLAYRRSLSPSVLKALGEDKPTRLASGCPALSAEPDEAKGRRVSDRRELSVNPVLDVVAGDLTGITSIISYCLIHYWTLFAAGFRNPVLWPRSDATLPKRE